MGVPLVKVRVPLGVIAVIYEARPHLSIDTPALALKSGNVCILKGGSEARFSNRILVRIFRTALRMAGIPQDAVQLFDAVSHAHVRRLLQLHEYIDVVIPRGGYGLMRAVLEQSSIPALYHADGRDSIYVDQSADPEIARRVVVNAKVQRPSVCNAVDTLLVHRGILSSLFPLIAIDLLERGVELRCDQRSLDALGKKVPHRFRRSVRRARVSDFDT